ncbi:MAG: hypothetical protein WEC59_10525 [Salibacteraceae bacterium]
MRVLKTIKKDMDMKNLICISLLTLFTFTTLAQALQNDTPRDPKPIFEFDEISMISISISHDDYLEQKRADPGKMRHWTNVLKKHLRTQKDFELFWTHLEKVEYKESTLDEQHYDFLRDTIFIEKYCDFVKMSKGDAFYDRILVFKQDGKAIGLAKLSRQGGIGSFAPKTVFTDCFGQYREFERIDHIFEP